MLLLGILCRLPLGVGGRRQRCSEGLFDVGALREHGCGSRNLVVTRGGRCFVEVRQDSYFFLKNRHMKPRGKQEALGPLVVDTGLAQDEDEAAVRVAVVASAG